jgi:ABC-type spermidine/putrescine transport system permease subunit I
MKPVNQKAWWLVLPVVICVAFSAVLPLMTVVNYSVQDIISPERRVFVGTEWFAAVMRDEELHAALWRQLSFSLAVLAVEIPLGIALALSMPARGWQASLVLVLVALSLLIPWNVVGTIWQIYGRADIGLLGAALAWLGVDYSYTGDATHAWITVLVMDVWHWTPLVALLCYAGLRSIPDAYYQAARIDGASRFAVFRYIQLPKLRGGADDRGAAAVHGQLHDLHRTVRADRRRAGQRHHFFIAIPDSESGRPVRSGASRRLLADLFPHHPAAVFHPLQLDAAGRHGGSGRARAMNEARFRWRTLFFARLSPFRAAADLLDGQHEL